MLTCSYEAQMIHSSIILSTYSVAVVLKSIPAVTGRQAGYAMDRSEVYLFVKIIFLNVVHLTL